MERDAYTVREVSQLLGKHEQTVRKLIRKQLIPGGHYDARQRFYVVWKQPFDAWRAGQKEAA